MVRAEGCLADGRGSLVALQGLCVVADAGVHAADAYHRICWISSDRLSFGRCCYDSFLDIGLTCIEILYGLLFFEHISFNIDHPADLRHNSME